MRQSNRLAPGLAHWDGPHTIQHRDIIVKPAGLHVIIRSSKTIRSLKGAVKILVPALNDPRYCPVRAWCRYKADVKPAPTDPAFIRKDGSALTPAAMTRLLRNTLKLAGHHSWHSLTLHGMRRRAAQACIRQGASIQAVKDLGTWLSSAVYSYVPKELVSEAAVTLGSAFGSGRLHRQARQSTAS